MKARRANERGFTLLELLMVVVILAILAAIAVPQYLKVVEKSRISEAISLLGNLRNSEMRYRAEFATYTTTLANLDFDPSTADVVGTKLFAYSVVAGPGGIGTSFQARATRGVAPAVAPGCTAGYIVSITHDGITDGTDCQ